MCRKKTSILRSMQLKCFLSCGLVIEYMEFVQLTFLLINENWWNDDFQHRNHQPMCPEDWQEIKNCILASEHGKKNLNMYPNKPKPSAWIYTQKHQPMDLFPKKKNQRNPSPFKVCMIDMFLVSFFELSISYIFTHHMHTKMKQKQKLITMEKWKLGIIN